MAQHWGAGGASPYPTERQGPSKLTEVQIDGAVSEAYWRNSGLGG